MQEDFNNIIEVEVNAKINPVLDIVGMDEKGYHILDGVAVKINLFDKLTIRPRKDNSIVVSLADKKEIPNNTAMIMASKLFNRYELSGGLDIFIEKGIPESAGLGGSSADAAGVAFAIEKLYDISVVDEDLLAVGADVPFMYYGGCQRVGGIGEILQPIEIYDYEILILVGGKGSKSLNAYKKYDIVGGEHGDVDAVVNKLKKGATGNFLFNALERSAESQDVIEKKKIFNSFDISTVAMSGSGDAVVAYIRKEQLKRLDLKAIERLALEKNYKLIKTKISTKRGL